MDVCKIWLINFIVLLDLLEYFQIVLFKYFKQYLQQIKNFLIYFSLRKALEMQISLQSFPKFLLELNHMCRSITVITGLKIYYDIRYHGSGT